MCANMKDNETGVGGGGGGNGGSGSGGMGGGGGRQEGSKGGFTRSQKFATFPKNVLLRVAYP